MFYYLHWIGATPESISQMGSLTKLSGTGFIVTIRKEDYDLWQKDLAAGISKLEDRFTIRLEILSFDDAKSFLLHRLESEEFQISNATTEKPVLLDRTIRLIWEKGEGNPRAMLRLASSAFRKAVLSELKTVEPVLMEATR